MAKRNHFGAYCTVREKGDGSKSLRERRREIASVFLSISQQILGKKTKKQKKEKENENQEMKKVI